MHFGFVANLQSICYAYEFKDIPTRNLHAAQHFTYQTMFAVALSSSGCYVYCCCCRRRSTIEMKPIALRKYQSGKFNGISSCIAFCHHLIHVALLFFASFFFWNYLTSTHSIYFSFETFMRDEMLINNEPLSLHRIIVLKFFFIENVY